MATSRQVVIFDDHFYCSICLETYNTPRTLPCLHSFCQDCLKGYILKAKETTGKQKLCCPVCRADTKTDNVKFQQVDNWVESFPINVTLLSILNEQKLKMNLKENDCKACLREDIKVDANIYCFDCSKHLCEDCVRHHMKNDSFLDHKLIETIDKADTASLKYLQKLSTCSIHDNEEVKYLCQDHDHICCKECAKTTHKNCEDMILLEEKVKVDTKSVVQERLDIFDRNLQKLTQHEITYLLSMEEKENEVKGCLKNLKAKLDDIYNKLENRIMSEISERKEALAHSSSLQTESAEKLRKEVNSTDQVFKKVRKMGTSVHAFLLEREMCDEVNQFEKSCDGLRQRSSKTLISLSESSALQEVIRNIENAYQIEEVDGESLLSSFSRSMIFSNGKLILDREVSLNDSQPRYCTWVGNYIIVSFETSSKLEAYNVDDGLLLSTYNCPSPTSIVATENEEFAVALPPSNKINVMKIEQNQIVCIRKIACSRLDLIAFNKKDKHFLTLSKSETLIRKITLDGIDAGSIYLAGNIRNHLKFTLNFFIDPEYGNILISSHGKCMLIYTDMSGNLIFEHKIANPWSVISDSQGNIYVASYSKNVIQKLSLGGKLLASDLLQDNKVAYPMAMSFSKDMNKMVVTCFRDIGRMRIYKVENE